MRKQHHKIEESIAQVQEASWRSELEKVSLKYHTIAAWIAIIFDPLFAITDYYNIPENWQTLLYIRLSVAGITLTTVLLHRRFQFASPIIVIVPALLISLQNAITYKFIGAENLLGHNLNYMALFIGAAMFLAWDSYYSMAMLVVSSLASAFFLNLNPAISFGNFFVHGGLLLMAVGVFMFVLIKTRYSLTVKEIKARLALQFSNEQIHRQNEEIQKQSQEIQSQAEKISSINNNLELLVRQRTIDLERKSKALQEYAFINAHKLRSPVASILGLIDLARTIKLDEEGKIIMDHLQHSAQRLNKIVTVIRKTIEKADF
jgi:signal transduction histidine kinase